MKAKNKGYVEMNTLKHALIGAAIVGLATVGGAGAALSQSNNAGAPKQNWNATVTETDAGGHLIGNPQAKTVVTEYVSYTCPHCATFTLQGDPALKLFYVPTGKVAVEIRHFVRDQVDLTAALLANCGPKEKFPRNHNAIMLSQGSVLARARRLTDAQIQRWNSTDKGAARRAMAGDLGMYDTMETLGFSRSETNACLADEAKAKQLAEGTNATVQNLGIRSTPSFTLNGTVLQQVHAWGTLQPAIDADMAAKTAQ